MTAEEWAHVRQRLNEVLPGWDIDIDNEDQIIIYTGVSATPKEDN
jgi:hypothetical protein